MRAEGWESALAAYIEAARGRAFAWGTHDCALWAAGWVRLATGVDFLADWEGRYATGRGAARLMKARGFASAGEIAASHLPERRVAMARRGDLVLYPEGALGICGGRAGHFVTAGGLLTLETLRCPRAWGVD